MIDSFSGPALGLWLGHRTPENVLAALKGNPRVSTWDMESAWLRDCIDMLKRDGRITEDTTEPYPWHRFVVAQEQGESDAQSH